MSGKSVLFAQEVIFKEPRWAFFVCFGWLFLNCFLIYTPYIFSAFSAEAVLFLVYQVVILALGNTPYGKRHNSRTQSPFWLQSILEESLLSRQYFWTTARSIRHILQSEKSRRNERYKVYYAIYWSTWKSYDFSRDRCCLTLNFGDNANHAYSHRSKPLTEPRLS